jgi:mRNA interferase HigB
LYPKWEHVTIELVVIAGRDRLQKLAKKHGDARSPLGAWIREVEAARWQRMADVKARYPKASILSDNRVVFDIKGKRYRVPAQIAFRTQRVVILRAGTHAEYDRWKL